MPRVVIKVSTEEAQWFGNHLAVEIPQRGAEWHQSMEYMIQNCFLERVQAALPRDAKPEGALAPTKPDAETAALIAAAQRATAAKEPEDA